MLIAKIGNLITLICVAASHTEYPQVNQFCRVGDIAENECNNCICSTEGIFECNPKPCNDTGIPSTTGKASCHSNILYVRNSTVCRCNDDGSWPHEYCETIFKSFPKKTKLGCKPNSYVIIDCNVCKCGPNGNFDEKHCTKKECNNKEKPKARRRIHQNIVYGSCKPKNWYSLAPCQFCFCIRENKLVCNTGNHYSRKLQLGSYNLSICGKDLIKDAISLVPEDEVGFMRIRDKFDETPTDLPTKENAAIPNFTEEENASLHIHELNRENNEKVAQEQLEKKLNKSEEYYSDSEDVKAFKQVERGGFLLTQSPYQEKDRDVIEDFKEQSVESDNDEIMSIIIDAPRPLLARKTPSHQGLKQKHFQKHYNLNIPERTISASGAKQPSMNDEFNLRDLLKPYLPVVLDKVFQMALRKSMVSVEDNTNCIPGTKTVFKCNSCFCMKNNKLLCTNHECNKLKSPSY